MRKLLVKVVAAGAMATAVMLGWGPAATAATAAEPGTVIPVSVQFSGSGTGPTAGAALANALADAEAQAAAEGFTDCAILGISVELIQPSIPRRYLGHVLIGC
jgi:hypothetical protein